MLVIRLVDGGGGNFADAKMPFFILYYYYYRLASRDGAGYVKKRDKNLLKTVLGIRKSRARENS